MAPGACNTEGRGTLPTQDNQERSATQEPDQGARVFLFPTPAPRVVGCRVDALSIGVKLRLDRGSVAAWLLAAPGASPGVVEVDLDGWTLGPGQEPKTSLFLRQKGAGVLVFENGDLRGKFDSRAQGGCPLEVTFRASFLATHDLDTCVAYVRCLGSALGVVEGLCLRRLDLAADVAWWRMTEEDRSTWQRPGRTGFCSFVELDKDGEPLPMREHGGGGRKITGYTIGMGGHVMARIYDKLEQLNMVSPEKRLGECSIWAENGWDGQGPITRVEFQIRSQALKTFGLLDPLDLDAEALGSLWCYLTQEWLIMRQPTSARTGRCKLDPRWEVVQKRAFEHAHTPAARVYFRRGAGAKHALGTWLSFAAHAGGREGAGGLRIPFPQLPARDLSVPAERLKADVEAFDALAKVLAEWAKEGMRLLLDELVKEHGAQSALVYVLERGAGVLARASSVAGASAGPRPEDLRPRKKPRIVLWMRKMAAAASAA